MTEDPRSVLARLEVQKLELLAQNAQLAAENELLRLAAAAFAHTPVAQLVVEKDASIQGANAAAAALFRLPVDKLSRGRLDAFVARTSLPDLRRFLDAVFEHGQSTCEVALELTNECARDDLRNAHRGRQQLRLRGRR